MPGILAFESNMPIILIVIIIVLVSVYFYLDSKKSKIQIENLEKKTEVIVKEIDNIHLQLHKFFSKMPTSIIPDTSMKSEDNDPEPVKVEIKSENNNVELSVSDFNNLKKDNDNTDTLKEIESMISDNNTNNSILDEGDLSVNQKEEISDNLNNSIIDEINLDDEDDEVEDDEDDEVEDINLSDSDSDKLSEYLEMSVKDLKSKCIEMNLKHSGNKTTLARRIVENLE